MMQNTPGNMALVSSKPGDFLEKIDELEEVDVNDITTPTTALAVRRIDSGYDSDILSPTELRGENIGKNYKPKKAELLDSLEELLNTELKDSNTVLKLENDGMKKTIDQLESKNKILEKNNEVLKMEVSLCTEQFDIISDGNKSLEKRVEALLEEKKQLQEHLVSLQENLSDTVEANVASLDILKMENLKINKELEKAKKSKDASLSEEVQALRPLLEEARARNDDLTSDVKGLEDLVNKKDRDLLILQDRNYFSEVKLSKTRKYIRHREREFKEDLQGMDFQFKRQLSQLNFNNHQLAKARDFFWGKANSLESKCKSLERTQLHTGPVIQNTQNIVDSNAKLLQSRLAEEQKKFQSQSEALQSLQVQLSEAKKNYALVEKSLMDQKLVMQSQSMENKHDAYEVMKSQFSTLAAEVEAKDGKLEEVAKEIAEKDEAMRQQKLSYDSLKKKLAEKDKMLTEVKNRYQDSKKASEANRKQSENVVNDQKLQIQDLVTHINMLNEGKTGGVDRNIHETLLKEYKLLKDKNHQLQKIINPSNSYSQPADQPHTATLSTGTDDASVNFRTRYPLDRETGRVLVDGMTLNTTGLELVSEDHGVSTRPEEWSEADNRSKPISQFVNPAAVCHQKNVYKAIMDTTDYSSQAVARPVDDYDLGLVPQSGMFPGEQYDSWDGSYFPPDDFCGEDE